MSDNVPNFVLDLTAFDSDENDLDFSQVLTQEVKEQTDILNKAMVEWDSDTSFGKYSQMLPQTIGSDTETIRFVSCFESKILTFFMGILTYVFLMW